MRQNFQVVENIQCYYLIPGTIVQVIKEDPARGMSEMRLGSITTPLWTYTRFLSKHPVKDTYGVIETPENSGLIPTADTAIVPAFPSDNPPLSRWSCSHQTSRCRTRKRPRGSSKR